MNRLIKRLLYLCGIDEGTDKRAYLGKRFRPGLWILRNFLWNSGLVMECDFFKRAYDRLNKLILKD